MDQAHLRGYNTQDKYRQATTEQSHPSYQHQLQSRHPQQDTDGRVNPNLAGAPPGYDEIMRSAALRSNQKYSMAANQMGTPSQNNIGQYQKQNGSPPQKAQWATQTASTRYMTSSSQNYQENDAPRIDQAFEQSEQGTDFINLNNQFEDNSMTEGGAEDNQEFAQGMHQQSQELQQNTKQYIPYNVRKERYLKEEQQDFDQFVPKHKGQKSSEDFGSQGQRPNFNRFSNEMTHNQNMNQRNSGGSNPKKSEMSPIGHGEDDMDAMGINQVQSHDQITVEIEMIENSGKNKRQSHPEPESNDSESSSQGSPRCTEAKQNAAIGAMPIQNLQILDDHQDPEHSNGERKDLMQEQQSHSQSEEDPEEEEQSLNDRQEDMSNERNSQGNEQSVKISNKDATQSDNGEDDGEEDDDEDTASLDSIDKIQNILNEINDQCIEHLKNEETDQALENLKRAEQILEDYTNEGKDVDRNMIIIVLYNQACCYQRLSMLDDCSNYLDGTIFNLQQKLLNFEEQEQEIRDMINIAEDGYGPSTSRQTKTKGRQVKQHTYGYDDEDDYMDNAADSNPYEVQDYDQYGLQKGKTQDRKNKNYNLSSLSITGKGKYNDGLSDHGAQSEQSHDFQDLNDIQEPSENDDNDPDAMAEIESSKKLSISQKLFKLRYLCKCHLQLCAVQSQLNKHKDALHHGQMASVYCQELIRNSKVLCEGYIGEILGRKKNPKQEEQQQTQSEEQLNKSVTSKDDGDKDSKKSEKDNLGIKLKENYYLEDDAKLLDVLIKNCHPILTDMLKQVDNFNQYNEITENSKIAVVREQEILRGLRMEVANTEFDQDLMQLIETKEHFSINLETKQNIERFKVYEAELRKKGYKSDQQLNKSSMKGDIFGQLESEEKQMSRKNSRKSIGRKPSAKQFVDEVAPNQPQFELSRPSNPKVKENEEHDVYFKNDDQLNTSINSTGTYGQFNTNFQSAGIGPQTQGYLKLRDNVKTVLVTLEEDDWIFNLNIGNVMHLQPLSSEQMNLHVDNSHELSRDAMLEKIILLTVSYFCVGTELRFLNNNSNSNDDKIDPLNKTQKEKQSEIEKEKKKKKEFSEMWHAQALEASARFLPSECPLVAHVITNYQKHHSPALTIIPEDEELQEDLRVVRPLNEVKNDNINYYQIIRNHLKIERKPPSPKKSPRKKQKDKGKNILKKDITDLSETPEPIAVNPKAIPMGPERQNFLEKEQQQQFVKLQGEQQKQQNILVNDFQFDDNKDGEALSPDDFNCEEFGKDAADANPPSEFNNDNADKINFYPQNDIVGNENIAGSQSDDPDAVIQLLEQRDHFESVQASSDKYDPQSQQNQSQKLTQAKSTNQIKTKKMPKSPASLQQSLSGTNFQNTQSFKIPSGMQFLHNKQDTQRSTGRIKIKKTVGENKQGKARDTLANRNQNTHVNSTGLTRIGSIKQRLKMMPSTKSTKMIKSGSAKKPMNVGQQPVKKMTDGTKTNQQSSQFSKQKKSTQNLKVPPSHLNNFASTSKLQTMKSFSPSASNQISLGPSFGQANLSNNNPNSKKNIQSSKQLKQYINQGQKMQKPPTQQQYSSQRKQSSNGQQNQMSIAQNIQKITQVLSQKISSMSQSIGNSSRQNSKARQEEPPAQHETSAQKFNKVGKDAKRKSSENQTNEISSDDDAEANIGAELANDISAERPGNGPAQKIRILHNVPKVSSSNLMIKTKSSMNFSKGFQNMQGKNMSNQVRLGSGTRMMGNQGSFRPSLTGNHNGLSQNQMQNKRLSIKVVGQKKASLAIQDPNALKINTNMMGKPPANTQLRTPQNQVQTRLMPSSVNNFSTQNNMYHRALMHQQQQQQQQNSMHQQMTPQNQQRQQSFPVSNTQNPMSRKSNASTGSGSGKFDERIHNKQQQMLIAQQNIKNIQSNMMQRNNVPIQKQQNHQNREGAEVFDDRGAMSPSAASNGLNNTNCNVTASLNNISGLSNILQSAPGTTGGQQRMSQHQKLGNQMQMMHQQQQPGSGGQQQQQQQQQINRLPLSTQKFRQPMRIMKFKK